MVESPAKPVAFTFMNVHIRVILLLKARCFLIIYITSSHLFANIWSVGCFSVTLDSPRRSPLATRLGPSVARRSTSPLRLF